MAYSDVPKTVNARVIDIIQVRYLKKSPCEERWSVFDVGRRIEGDTDRCTGKAIRYPALDEMLGCRKKEDEIYWLL